MFVDNLMQLFSNWRFKYMQRVSDKEQEFLYLFIQFPPNIPHLISPVAATVGFNTLTLKRDSHSNKD